MSDEDTKLISDRLSKCFSSVIHDVMRDEGYKNFVLDPSIKPLKQEHKIRDLIEGGAPEDLVQSFHDLPGTKINGTKQFARQTSEDYGLLSHLLRGS